MNTPSLYFVVFILMSSAIFLFLRLDLVFKELSLQREKAKSFKPPGKIGAALDKAIRKSKALVVESGMPKGIYIAMTIAGAAAGFTAGKLIYSSTLIAYAVAVIGMISPLLVLGFNMTKSGTAKAERLCSSMTVVTNSYLSTEDIIRSVSGNLDNLDYPAPFRSFLAYVTHMDSDVQHGLRRMEAEVNNPYFSQWIDALCIAQGDRALKYVSVSVVESMRDVISAQQESDAAMFAVWRDYLLTLILIFSVPLIFKFMMPDAYVTLTTSAAGQSMFMLLLGAVLFSVFRALHINTPIV